MAGSTKPGISLEMGLEEGYAALGYISGIATAIDTDRYIGSVLNYTHSKLAEAFDEEMDVIAFGNPSGFHHVYEWRMLGNPKGRLWKHKVTGGGGAAGGRVRGATFEFKSSIAPILTPHERSSDPNDPMYHVPQNIINHLKPRKYFFYNKAAMMEYGLRANVRPKYGKWLFVPTTGPMAGPKNFYLSKQTPQDFSYANPQDQSGGPGTVGRFTSAWVLWWNEVAPVLWDKEVKKTIERGLGKSEAELKKTVNKRRVKNKVIGIGVFNSEVAAFESGKNLARAYIFGEAQSYNSAAEYIRKHGERE